VLLRDEVGFLHDYFALMGIRYGEVVRNRAAPKEVIRGVSGFGVSKSGLGLSNLDERCRLAMGARAEVLEAKGVFAVY
jgi:hypothetical protein